MRSPSMMSKYAGLKMIEEYGLPHPNWRFFTSPSELQKQPWTEAPHGWTIRCAPTLQYSFALPSRHCLPFDQVGDTRKKMVDNTKVDMFVVYPSWKFDISGGLLLDGPLAHLEVVRGDIAGLLRGSRSPDASFSYSIGLLGGWICVQGHEDILSQSDRALFINAVRILSSEDRLLLEWTKTSEGGILFHDCVKFG